MKLFKVIFEKTRNAPVVINVPEGEKIILAFLIQDNGEICGETVVVQNGSSYLSKSQYGLADYNCFDLTVDSNKELKILDATSTFHLTVKSIDTDKIDVSLSSAVPTNPTFEDITIGTTTLDEENLKILNKIAGETNYRTIKFGNIPDGFTATIQDDESEETSVWAKGGVEVKLPTNSLNSIDFGSDYSGEIFIEYLPLSGGNGTASYSENPIGGPIEYDLLVTNIWPEVRMKNVDKGSQDVFVLGRNGLSMSENLDAGNEIIGVAFCQFNKDVAVAYNENMYGFEWVPAYRFWYIDEKKIKDKTMPYVYVTVSPPYSL